MWFYRNLFTESILESNASLLEEQSVPATEPHEVELVEWCNSHLEKKNISIHNLSTDLRSGVRLIQLLEVFLSFFIKNFHWNFNRL